MQIYPEEIFAPTSYHTKFKTSTARLEANDLRCTAKPLRKETMHLIEVNYNDAKETDIVGSPYV